MANSRLELHSWRAPPGGQATNAGEGDNNEGVALSNNMEVAQSNKNMEDMEASQGRYGGGENGTLSMELFSPSKNIRIVPKLTD